MTPERRKALAGFLRALASQTHPLDYQAEFRDAADALESAGTCGFCGREVHADLKPMCGDCAGKEDPATVVLRADLAKAKERGDMWKARADEFEHALGAAKERIGELEAREGAVKYEVQMAYRSLASYVDGEHEVDLDRLRERLHDLIVSNEWEFLT